LDAVRQWVLEWRVRGDARRRERERLKVAAAEARESEARARARLKEQAGARRTEEEAAARQHAQQNAEAERQQRIAVAATEAELLLQKAGQLRVDGDKRGAVAVLGKLVRQQPDSAMGWFTLGWYFGRDGNFRRSTRCYKKGLKLDPGQKTAWNNLGHDLRGMRRYKASEQALRQAVKLDADYVTAWANLGTTLREKKNLSGAAGAFQEVVRRRESDGPAWYWLGICRAGCGDHAGAVEALQRASVMHPDNASLWVNLADSLRKLGRIDEATQARAKAKSLGIPSPILRREVPLLALVAAIASFGADRLTSALLGLAATVAFAVMMARLSLDRVRFFWIAVLALPLLAVQFIDEPHAAPIAMAVLLVWTAAVTKIWRYRRGNAARGSPQTARTN
jgi:tetratricopeptide (TPR) repeat protein